MKGGLTALYWVHQGNTFLLSGIFVYKAHIIFAMEIQHKRDK